MAAVFTWLIVLQFLIILSHDLINVPGWIHGSQVQAQIGKRKVWLATLANAVLPGIAAGFALHFWGRSIPGYASSYWVIYCFVALLSAVGMWYVPYLRGRPKNRGGSTSPCMPERGRFCLRAETIPGQICSMWESTYCLW